MTELREPPLLGGEEKEGLCEQYPLLDFSFEDDYREEVAILLNAERDICIKWMKEHCYLMAKRELPERPYGKIMVTTDSFAGEIISYRNAQQDMLQEDENGISFKACREFIPV